MERIEAILSYWFGPAEHADLPDDERTRLWFGAEANTDEEIRHRFQPVLLAIKNNELAHWYETPRGLLAAIIVLDQFSRNIYRGKPSSFAQDDQALRLCYEGLEKEFDQRLSLIERVFFYLPLEHSEDREDQIKSVVGFKSLVDLALPETRPIFENFYHYALEHYRIIEQFGRFPHRNAILGRKNTSQEEAYLTP
ncbi:MAG: DUF924 domain-containing protein [Legionellales bacterium]|nr:DUF924 domain-containing protein [Legionellales bacterium]